MFEMIFNDVDFTPHLKVEWITRELLPPRNITSIQIPGALKGKFNSVEYGIRTIKVVVRMHEKTKRDVLEKSLVVAGLLNTEEPKKLILRDDPSRYNIAILSGETEIEKFLNTGGVELIFMCLDPVNYAIEPTIAHLGISTQVINSGTCPIEDATIEVTLSTPQSYLEILQVNTGEKIYIQHSFTAGDKVLINLGEEYVAKNDSLIMKDVHLISDFFKIPVGLSTINLSSGVGTLIFRQGWL